MTVQAVFYTQPEFGVRKEYGRVTMQNGVVTIDPQLGDFDNERIYSSLENTEERLTPADGEAFVRALPVTFRSPYLWAELSDDGQDGDTDSGSSTLSQSVNQSRAAATKAREEIRGTTSTESG